MTDNKHRKKRGVPRPIVHREPQVESFQPPSVEAREGAKPAPPPPPDKLKVVGEAEWEASSRSCPYCESCRRQRYYGGNGPLLLYGCTDCCRRYRVLKGKG